MPIPSGFGLVQYIFGGSGAGPGGCMVTLGVDHEFLESPSTLAQELSDAFADNILPGLTTDVSHDSTRLRIGTPTGEVVVEVAGGGAGSDTSTTMPPNVALPVTKFSSFGGRANRGRWFLPGLAEDQVDSGGFINPTDRAAWDANFIGFFTALSDADFTPVILHSDSELAPTVVIVMLTGAKVFTRGSRLR